jgi:hypothetical protein
MTQRILTTSLSMLVTMLTSRKFPLCILMLCCMSKKIWTQPYPSEDLADKAFAAHVL